MNKKFRWQETDPHTGLDIHVVEEFVDPVSSEGQCKDGIYRPSIKGDGSGNCYSYNVLRHVCMLIGYRKNLQGFYEWTYTAPEQRCVVYIWLQVSSMKWYLVGNQPLPSLNIGTVMPIRDWQVTDQPSLEGKTHYTRLQLCLVPAMIGQRHRLI